MFISRLIQLIFPVVNSALDKHVIRRDMFRVALLLGGLVLFGLVFQYRYLILSRLNIPLGTGESEQALGLKRIKDVPVPGNPTRFEGLSLDQDRRLLFIADQGDGELLVFSLVRQTIVGQVGALGDVRGVDAIPDLRRVFVTTSTTNQLVSVDVVTLQVVRRVDAGEQPEALAYIPDLGKLFLSDPQAGSVTVLDAVTGRWQTAIEIGGIVGRVVYDPISRRLYVAAQSRNQIFEIDPRTNTVTKKIDLAGCGGPRGLYVDGIARLVFIGCVDNAQLAILDLESEKVAGLRSVGEGPDVLAFDEVLRRLYVAAESGFVTVFQEHGRNLEPRGGAYLAPAAHTIAVDSLTHRIYIPLENVGGHPIIRVLAPIDVRSPD